MTPTFAILPGRRACAEAGGDAPSQPLAPAAQNTRRSITQVSPVHKTDQLAVLD